MTTVWLFPGQGMEAPHMGLALADAFPRARALLELAGAEADVDPFRLLRRGGPALERTAVLQPLLTAVSLGVAAALQDAGASPDVVAGHSAGEVAAWCAAGGLSGEDAVRLAAARGRCMQAASETHEGGMLALLTDETTAREALARGQEAGPLVLAAHNAPTQWVVTGSLPALAAAGRVAPAKRLPVAGAWHSPFMAGAVGPLAEAVTRCHAHPTTLPVIANRTGEPAGDALRTLLPEQLIHPVRWADSLCNVSRTATRFVTVGPGRVLRGLVRQNLGTDATVLTTEGPDDMQATIATLTGRTSP